MREEQAAQQRYNYRLENMRPRVPEGSRPNRHPPHPPRDQRRESVPAPLDGPRQTRGSRRDAMFSNVLPPPPPPLPPPPPAVAQVQPWIGPRVGPDDARGLSGAGGGQRMRDAFRQQVVLAMHDGDQHSDLALMCGPHL